MPPSSVSIRWWSLSKVMAREWACGAPPPLVAGFGALVPVIAAHWFVVALQRKIRPKYAVEPAVLLGQASSAVLSTPSGPVRGCRSPPTYTRVRAFRVDASGRVGGGWV